VGSLRIAVLAWLGTLVAVVARYSFKLRTIELIVGGGITAQLYLLAVSPPTIEMPLMRSTGDLNDFLMGLAIVGFLAGTGLAERSPISRWWFPAVVAVHFMMGHEVLKLAPNPNIDVFVVETESLKALFAGTNPYGITWPNLYGDNTPFYPPGVSINGRLQFGYVYPPLSLLMLAPGWLLASDPRYSTLAAMSVAALLMGYARPGALPKLAATLFLFTPRAFFVLDRAWTDPFVVVLTALVVFVAIRRPKWLFIPIGLFACLKQHMFIGLPAVWCLLPRPIDWKATFTLAWKSMAVGVAVTLPFFLWSPSAFANSVLNIREVYRLDCLSLLAYFANTGVVTLSKWSGIVAIIPVVLIGVWRAPRTPAGFATLVAATHFTVYIFSTHAFCNEYYNVVGSLCVAIAVWKAPVPAAVASAVPPPVTARVPAAA
jgi:hypothetical protein